ncbi:phage terminase large subunit family protein [Chromobacterium haemolyticum]|uniref:Phage terminase large subunit family protein n=1 Tax=Chromobacterium fluminis TaxID=3044269 RepID=A0ABX0LDG0_9NEIS|nr:phage terminase large subunit family protein [Chromobacterium haemolyticum]NHR07656.1 phage terminase large subunit family protein [Chromobacterium haemolyticum]
MDRSEIQKAIQRGLTPMGAPDPLTLSEWAAEHFYLSAESSYVEQKWEAYPPQVAVMNAISNDDIREVDWIKSARVGYTKIILAAMLYMAEHKRRNQAIWQPTDDDSDDFVKTELEPALRDVTAMRKVFPQYLARHKSNTLKQKKFVDSILFTKGGKAAKNFRRISIDTGFLDEADAFDRDVEKEGDPFTLAKKRTEGATFPKMVVGSTPKLKGFSLIEDRAALADVLLRFHIRCPHCGEWITLQWGGKDKPFGFKWVNGDPETVAHLCCECSALFTQADYLTVWGSGRWISDSGIWTADGIRFYNAADEEVPVPVHVAFHIWTAYSPQATWADIVREFLAAAEKAKAGDMSKMKTFVNTTRGEVWEEDVEKTDSDALAERAESFPLRVVPMGGLVLVAGVDVQADRFEVVVWALGRGEESWTVDYVQLHANPADETEWDKLDAYLQTAFPHAAGSMLTIEAAAVDTGGHYTHQAYNFCRQRARRKIFAVKGDSQQGKPIKGRSSSQDVNWRGKVIKRGVKLWLVGTDTAKDLLHGRLQIVGAGPGAVHFSKELPETFYKQLTSEYRVLAKTQSGDQYRWVKPSGKRNEVLDCTVYSMFCAQQLDLHRFTDKMWERLEAAVQPPNHDLFAAAPAPAPLPEKPPERPVDAPAPRPDPAPRRSRISRFA